MSIHLKKGYNQQLVVRLIAEWADEVNLIIAFSHIPIVQ